MKSTLLILSFLFLGNTFAQNNSEINFNFGLESYFLYDFNNPENKELPSFLYSHTRHNEISINNLYLKRKL